MKSIPVSRLSLVVLLYLMCFCGAFCSAVEAQIPTYTVPMIRLASGHIAVSVRINNKGPFRMILDTGSPITFVGTRAARQAGLLDAQAGGQAALFGMRGMAQAKTFRVGKAAQADFDLMLLDHPLVEMMSELVGRLDGIVGFTFFARYHTTLDYAGQTVSFSPVSYTPQNLMAGVMGRLMASGPETRTLSAKALWGMQVAKTDAQEGVLVTRVLAQSGAAAGGLQAGDRLLTLDNRWTESLQDVYDAASFVRPNQEVSVEVLRSGQKQTLHIRPRAGL